MTGGQQVRVDRWLWSVRIYKTRSQATDGCQGGHVRVNGRPAKPATVVRVGDRVEARAGRQRVLEVTALVDKRVGAPEAAGCYVDHSPPPPPGEELFPGLLRDRATGRPTKRDRRRINRVRGR
ncbi:MAG TPA: RNA-binding S4 domain-containing protein [Actinomycetota bacterium]|nr:RNA-binding S4 domain-containing protein [Actinomycetota bacterium]